MKTSCPSWVLLLTVVAGAVPSAADARENLAENQCVACHGNPAAWDGDTKHLLVTVQEMLGDRHWQQGLRCHDCHGGNPRTASAREAHAVENGFRKVAGTADLSAFCGHCHASGEGAGRSKPSDARTENAGTEGKHEFWQRLHSPYVKEFGAREVAACSSCHPKHGELPEGTLPSESTPNRNPPSPRRTPPPRTKNPASPSRSVRTRNAPNRAASWRTGIAD
jgi:hypothetical protein